MTQKVTSATGKKGNTFLRAIGDLVILCLLLAGSGFGGYFWGTHQQLAPIQKVPPGTPGAISATGTPSIFPSKSDQAKSDQNKSDSQSNGAQQASDSSSDQTSSDRPHSKKKFWISSSGTDYTGYSITVKVNDTIVDNFFGPGKSIDITRLVKSGENTVVLEAKELGKDYNKHSGDSASALILHVVSGPSLTDNFKSSDVLLTYKRTAAEDEDFKNTLHFAGD
jgi:hypothetical protein